MEKPCVVLQTDFGLTTGFVSSMYGVIKIVDHELDVYDLNHNIRYFDVRQASASLAATVPYWPKGTVFVSVVDPGVGTARRPCCAKLKNGSFIITPDNGTLTFLVPEIETVREIDESINRLPGSEKSNTFHGRDIFAYCAARLASGIITYEQVGREYPVSECVAFPVEKSTVKDGEAYGTINSALRHFGNISFNITIDEFEKTGIVYGDFADIRITKGSSVLFEGRVLYHRSFGYVDVGGPILFNGSTNAYLALGLNMKSFTDKYLPNIFNDGESFSDYKVSIIKAKEAR
jgi:S-adenosylmethionine hydrolase